MAAFGVSVGDDGHARDLVIVCGAHGQGVDVDGQAAGQARDAVQDARFVFYVGYESLHFDLDKIFVEPETLMVRLQSSAPQKAGRDNVKRTGLKTRRYNGKTSTAPWRFLPADCWACGSFRVNPCRLGPWGRRSLLVLRGNRSGPIRRILWRCELC